MIHPNLWQKLGQMDPADVCRRSGARLDTSAGGYLLAVLAQDHLVNLGQQSVQRVGATSDKPNFFLTLATVAYLIHSKAIPLAGEWVSEQSFPAAPLFFRGPHAMPVGKLLKRFGTSREAFAKAAAALGARATNGGDSAFAFPVFPRLPITVVLWLEDDEFPPRASYLFDKTACEHLPFDALWTTAKMLEDKLLAAALQPRDTRHATRNT